MLSSLNFIVICVFDFYRYTNPDGRCSELITKDEIKPGRFKLHFDTDKYYELRNNDRLFPFIEVILNHIKSIYI